MIEVDLSTAQVTGTPAGRSAPRSSSQQQPAVGAMTECVGSVKMYNAAKGFGFVRPDGGGKTVFVHATTLERGGLSGLTEGQRVRMQISQGQKGLEARSITLSGLNDQSNPRARIGITAPVQRRPCSAVLLRRGCVHHPQVCQTMPMRVISRTLASAAKRYGGYPPATHRLLLCSLIP